MESLTATQMSDKNIFTIPWRYFATNVIYCIKQILPCREECCLQNLEDAQKALKGRYFVNADSLIQGCDTIDFNILRIFAIDLDCRSEFVINWDCRSKFAIYWD